MPVLSIILLAFSMAADAFAAAIGKGATMRQPTLREALRIGAIFGITEGITPVIGWLFGRAASSYITTFDHWIAFAVLVGIGGKMIWESFHANEDVEPLRHSFTVLVVTAIGTSIDALAVGVTFALVEADIVVNAVAIGLATFVMSTFGILAGKVLGARSGRYAEIIGGLILMAIGMNILLEHTVWA